MIVFMLVMSLFSKNKMYGSIFRSALKEGVNDWCREMGYSKQRNKSTEIPNKNKQKAVSKL
jgi:hypothetical protein